MSNDDKIQARRLIDEAVEKQPETPKKGCRRGCRRGCLIFVLVFAFPFYWIGCHTTPLRVSYETTRALGPMTSDGKRVDYFRAYEEKCYPPEMQTDENGYRMIVRALGYPTERWKNKFDPETGKTESVKIEGEPFRRQVCEKLGLDPDVPPTLFSGTKDWSSYYPAKEAAEKRNEENPDERIDVHAYYQKIMRAPWTLEEYPFMKDWLERSGPAIDLVGEAARKPFFQIPFTRENENTPTHDSLLLLEDIQQFREWARTVSSRAWYRIGTGDIDGAIGDIVTIHRLARHAGKHPTLVSYLVGLAIEGLATNIGIAADPEHPPTREQIVRLLAELDKLPPRTTMNEALESERYFMLASLQDIFWGISSGSGYPAPPNTHPFMRWTVDINLFMARGNKIYDGIIDGTFDEDSLRDNFWNPFYRLTVRGRSIGMMNSLAALFFPSIQAGREAWRRCECASNMQRLTLALLLYEKEHGGMPEGDWREAVKAYLGAEAEKYFRCPSHHATREPGDVTTYAMISGVDNPSPTPHQILVLEVVQPQKLGEGDGRFPLEKAQFWTRLDDPDKPTRRASNFDALGAYHGDGMNCGFRSGAVRLIVNNIEPETLDALIRGTATEVP